MLCHQCEEPARGVCIFCGRAICKKHTQKMPAIISIYVGAVLPHLMRDNSDDLGWGAPGCESPTTGQISLAVDRICSSTEGL